MKTCQWISAETEPSRDDSCKCGLPVSKKGFGVYCETHYEQSVVSPERRARYLKAWRKLFGEAKKKAA